MEERTFIENLDGQQKDYLEKMNEHSKLEYQNLRNQSIHPDQFRIIGMTPATKPEDRFVIVSDGDFQYTIPQTPGNGEVVKEKHVGPWPYKKALDRPTEELSRSANEGMFNRIMAFVKRGRQSK